MGMLKDLFIVPAQYPGDNGRCNWILSASKTASRSCTIG